MDWKEGAKWIGVFVIAGVITSFIEIGMQKYINGAATAAAHAEVEKALADAVQQLRAQQAAAHQRARSPTMSIEPRKTSTAYSFTV